MSFQAVAWAIEQRVGDPILKNLLMAICHHASVEQWHCWPSQDLLAYETEVSKRTIQRKLKDLEEKGFIRIEPRRVDGKQASSMIYVSGGQPVTLTPSGGQAGRVQVDSKESTSNEKEDNNQSLPPAKTQVRAAKVNGEVYSEEFEEQVWKPYPRKANTSKKKAHDLWRMLNVENQERVKAAIPLYAAAMVREGRTEDKIKHLQFFLSERVYETVGAVAAPGRPAGGAAAADWYKTATRDQWARLLPIWRGDMNWRIAWGPAPGKPGCAVPPDMLTESDLR